MSNIEKRISFITTTFNEEKGIGIFLESILSQSTIPKEVIIVDAFSKDKTLDVIYSLQKKFKNKKIHLKIYSKRGNRSIGRNYAISKATGEIILASDAGCILHKNWVKKITKPFSLAKYDIVAGFYLPITRNTFQKSLAAYTCVPLEKVNSNFLPSSRSIAFRKKTWREVGGYPENLDTCEDLVFARNLQKKGYSFFVERKALVYWEQRENLYQAFVQFLNYAKGDGEALYIRRQTPLVFLRYIVALFIVFYSLKAGYYFIPLFCLSIYIAWAIFKNYRFVNKFTAIFFLPILQFLSDIAVQFGMLWGGTIRMWKNIRVI